MLAYQGDEVELCGRRLFILCVGCMSGEDSRRGQPSAVTREDVRVPSRDEERARLCVRCEEPPVHLLDLRVI